MQEEFMSTSTTELKNIFEMDRDELQQYNENKLIEFKELFLTTDLPVDEIYDKIGVGKNDPTYRYINGMRKTLGLSVNNRNITFKVQERTQKDIADENEEIYQQFKQLWLADPKISKTKVFQQLGVAFKKPIGDYVKKRMEEDGLPEHYSYNQSKPKKEQKPVRKPCVVREEYETKYQEYKDLFESSNLLVGDIYKKIGVTQNNQNCGGYILKRAKEDGLNSQKRRHLLKNKKKPKKKKKPLKTQPEKTPKKAPIKPVSNNKINKKLNESKKLLDKFYHERNIKPATQKGYIASLTRWFKYTDEKYNNLQECIDFYMKEEDEKIPMRNRCIKKEMLGFREWLLEDKAIKSDKSVRSYFSKLGTVFRHYGLEIPQLPQVKMEKGYVSNYNDLPTHNMIKTACEQSPLDLKALILFMSSSGSAKAETLSITVEMFLIGCEEYLEEPANANNIPETLKALSDKHDIVPLIYLRRIKTDKWYYTCCSPEASYMIIESLKTRKNLQWHDQLFDYTSSLILARFQEINDNNNWGHVGAYRRFRSHALRKFMASNIGLPRDQVDSFQGRAKDMIQEAYFKQDPKSLKKIYMGVMHRVMVYENWGHGTTLTEIEQRAKRIKNGFNDNEKILDLSVIPETPAEIKSSIGLGTSAETTVSSDKNSRNVKHNRSNLMPVQAPVQVPVGTVQGISISKELLQYAELMEKGLLSIGEFNRVKQTLLMSVLR